MRRLVVFWETICRMVWWGWKMRNNHDWEFGYLYHVIYLKLYRMDKTLLNGKSYAMWTSQEKSRTYRALKEAKEIARRLSTGEEECKYTMQFHEEYGFRDSLASLIDKECKTISEKEYSRLYRIAIKKDMEYYKNIKKRFYYLLEKHGEYWWD